jgi:hypothetical protein
VTGHAAWAQYTAHIEWSHFSSEPCALALLGAGPCTGGLPPTGYKWMRRVPRSA